jgi:hypothetical protein
MIVEDMEDVLMEYVFVIKDGSQQIVLKDM